MPATSAVVFPVVVSSTNQGWTYLRLNNRNVSEEARSLSLFGGEVEPNARVSSEAIRWFNEQTNNVFSGDSAPTGGRAGRSAYLASPVSESTMTSRKLTKIVENVPYGGIGRMARVNVIKAYVGRFLGEGKGDRFIKKYRDANPSGGDNRPRRYAHDMLRVNIGEIIDQMGCKDDRFSSMVKVYGENLDDMRQEATVRLDESAQQILRNRAVLLALSETVDELKQINPSCMRRARAA